MKCKTCGIDHRGVAKHGGYCLDHQEKRAEAAEARAAQLQADFDAVKAAFEETTAHCLTALQERDELARKLEQAQAALRPFAHFDLIKKLVGNEQGDASIVYQRNEAILMLGDFRRAYRIVNPVAEP